VPRTTGVLFCAPLILCDFPQLLGERAMNSLALKIRQFLVSEDGPTAVEYAVMLALIIIVCLTAISAIGTNASTTFNNVAQSIGAS
jgi:pilus assembly protein Flp/PilA